MNNFVIKAGLWSAAICLTSFVIWIISFVGIAITSPLFYWTNIEDYVEFASHNPQFFQYLAKSFMIVFALAYMVMIFVCYEFAGGQKKLPAKIAAAFAVMFALLASAHYFVQLSAVRFAMSEGQYSGLEHFLQARPTSVMSSLNMLGWTVFLGLSSFFMYLSLLPGAMTKAIRIGLLISAVSCLLAGAGYLCQIDLITFVAVNLGVGGAFLVITVSAIRFFIMQNRQ